LKSTALVVAVAAGVCLAAQAAAAQTQPQVATRTSAPAAPTTVPTGVELPPGYTIGTDDVLTVVVWREGDLSTDVSVRPDGMITLPLVNDVQAKGLTPDQLRLDLTERIAKFVEEPSVTVVVKQINSRKVYITGMVGKVGPFNLSGPTTVLQLISMAGGLNEFAKQKNIVIMRNEGDRQRALKFNYKDVIQGKNLQQNIELQPGDTVIVP
jgi:polysaccharide biosynthesis/export protein